MTEEEEEEARSFFSVVFDSTLSLAVPWSIEFCLISFALHKVSWSEQQKIAKPTITID